MQLRSDASGLPDARGRPLDGDRDGQPGGAVIATLSKQGVSLRGAR